MDESVKRLRAHTDNSFHARFGRTPGVLGLAPGRVELLGNHTDHNGGLVLSAAIDRYTAVAAAPNDSQLVRIWSECVHAGDEFSIGHVTSLPRGSWSNYVRAAVAGLLDAGVKVLGFDAVISSDVPLGGGLSSSASLECAVAMAIVGLFGADQGPSGMALARLLQQFEQRIVGVECGILDQFSSVFGRQGHALFLDCNTLAHDAAPLGQKPPAIIVCDSGVSRQLATGKYNERRAECDAALQAISKFSGNKYQSLSDVQLSELMTYQQKLDPMLLRRARHVLGENDRVRSGFEQLRRSGDVSALGQLMFQSHRSSRDDFENSSNELDGLVEIASSLPGCLGAKLSGAGWGGCTVNLVDPAHAGPFGTNLAEEYRARFGIAAQILTCQAAAGAHVCCISPRMEH